MDAGDLARGLQQDVGAAAGKVARAREVLAALICNPHLLGGGPTEEVLLALVTIISSLEEQVSVLADFIKAGSGSSCLPVVSSSLPPASLPSTPLVQLPASIGFTPVGGKNMPLLSINSAAGVTLTHAGLSMLLSVLALRSLAPHRLSSHGNVWENLGAELSRLGLTVEFLELPGLDPLKT